MSMGFVAKRDCNGRRHPSDRLFTCIDSGLWHARSSAVVVRERGVWWTSGDGKHPGGAARAAAPLGVSGRPRTNSPPPDACSRWFGGVFTRRRSRVVYTGANGSRASTTASRSASSRPPTPECAISWCAPSRSTTFCRSAAPRWTAPTTGHPIRPTASSAPRTCRRHRRCQRRGTRRLMRRLATRSGCQVGAQAYGGDPGVHCGVL